MLPWIRASKFKKKIVANGFYLMATIFVFFTIVFQPVSALAQTDNKDVLGLQPIQDTIILGNDDIRTIAGRIISVILGLLAVIAFGLVLYGGFLIMTSAGNEDKVTQGKKVLTNAVVGLVIILSSFAIVQFIFKSLSDVFGGDSSGNQNQGPQPFFADYAGTGGLGSVIKDHYPRPNQVNVARNIPVTVTFAEPILPSSLITNTNNTCWAKWGGNTAMKIPDTAPESICALLTEGPDTGKPKPFFGDCTDLDGNGTVSLETECDRVRPDAVQLYPKNQATSTQANPPMIATTIYNAEQKATIFTFDPLPLLGSDSANTWITVKLLGGDNATKGIKRLDGSDIFPQQFISKYYTWNFEVNTTVDLTPPFVFNTYPRPGKTIPRNHIVQITFNEPVSPMVTQGLLSETSSFSNLIFGQPGQTVPSPIKGEWQISNGYRTLEFIPTEECGQNSCGEKMYCLQTTCAVGDTACTMNYTTLIRTAALKNPGENSFEAQFSTGVTDMAGNALDNGPGNKPDGVLANSPANSPIPPWRHKPPLPANIKLIGDYELNPDNYFWNFKVQNDIDLSIPYITKVSPALEGEGIKGKDLMEIYFSKLMWYNSVPQGTGVLEYPENVEGKDKVKLESFPYYFDMLEQDSDAGTVAQLQHPREFGPGGLDLYYFTFVSSSVKSLNQNCLYPGRGPVPVIGEKNTSPVCSYDEKTDVGQNCVPVNFNFQSDTGCIFGQVGTDFVQPNLATCLTKVKAASPSSY